MSMYIYIRRPPLGGHQAAKSMLQSACSKSSQSFESQVDSQVFHSFQILQSTISSLPVWYQLLAVCFDLLTCLLYPTDRRIATYSSQPDGPLKGAGGYIYVYVYIYMYSERCIKIIYIYIYSHTA